MSIFDQLNNNSAVSNDPVKPVEGEFTFVFDSLPESADEIKSLPEASLDTPYKTAALTLCALCAYAAAPDIGREICSTF